MLRFICHLLGKPYEPCKSCEIAKDQIRILQEQNKDLLHTIVSLCKPQVDVVENHEISQPVTPRHVPWSVTRRNLEKKDKEINERIKASNPEVGSQINELEKTLEING